MDEAEGKLPEDLRNVFLWVQKPLLRSFMVFAMVLGLGGPTGFAANPARDCGPRAAHWVR